MPCLRFTARCDPAIRRLAEWRAKTVAAPPLDTAGVRKLLAALAADGAAHPPREWDDAAQQYLAAVVAYASGPVIKKYLGVLAAADVYTASTTFAILESIRLDLGFGSQVHP